MSRLIWEGCLITRWFDNLFCATTLPALPPIPVPRSRSAPMGPKQIEWCIQKIPHFAEHKLDADAVLAEMEENRKQYGAS
ncbi:MAG: hypothetical protein KGL39_39860 [Patescibacteria group bacterium]|nr:hypothetical protein [Patescibacteria group bacterium]